MTIRILPALLSGGAGTRLWPASTPEKPKQFHALAGSRTLLQETAARVAGEIAGLSFAAPIVLAAAQHADLIETQLSEIAIAPAALALEPMARNTAAAAAVAAAMAREIEPGALVLLLPADHVIADVAGFHALIARAAPFARDRIVTFGVRPDRPETGYGYIQRGAALGDGVFEIARFKEKPDAQTATTYVAQGDFDWNAGMFLFAPEVLLAEFGDHAAIRDCALTALSRARREGVRHYLDADAFAAAPSLPLDIAVMERTRRAAVAPCDIGWADLGAWDEIWRLAEKDAAGNTGAHAALEAERNLVRAAGKKVALLGVDDLIVILEGDTLLIAKRDRAQDVKRMMTAAQE